MPLCLNFNGAILSTFHNHLTVASVPRLAVLKGALRHFVFAFPRYAYFVPFPMS
jgi:hypothetical protein